MIKTVIFDADGVLIHAEMFSRQLESDYGIPVTEVDPFFEKEFQACLTGHLDLKEAIQPYLKKWGWQGTADELLDYWFTVEHKVDEELINYIRTLRAKKVLCYVATNQEKYRAQYMFERMGFKDVFEDVYASAHLGHKKPTQEFFITLLNRLHITDKSQVLFWDDSQDNIAAALTFGIKAEPYLNFIDFKQKMDHYLEGKEDKHA